MNQENLRNHILVSKLNKTLMKIWDFLNRLRKYRQVRPLSMIATMRRSNYNQIEILKEEIILKL